jgi:5'/3'-nucleotidase SurE
MYILITNDDGVSAPGLFALKRSLQSIADIVVVAPDRNWARQGTQDFAQTAAYGRLRCAMDHPHM